MNALKFSRLFLLVWLLGIHRRWFIMFMSVLLCFGFAGNAMAQEKADAEETGKAVYVIPLREEVDRYLGVFLGRSIEKAHRSGAEVLIFEIDTFGGRLDTALEIASKIGAASWAKTVAYIPVDSLSRGVSWSAGALMAFSSSELWMAPGTSMGAATPVLQSSEGMQAAGEKTLSAVRGQMAALAEKNGYPVSVAVAMVDSDIELLEVKVNDTLQLLSTDDIEELKRQKVNFSAGRKVSAKGKLLTLTSGEMKKYGISSGLVSSKEELVALLGYQMDDVVVLEKSRSDSLVAFLSSGLITSLLIIVALVGIYLEVNSPGFGIPGTVALISFAVVFGTGSLMGNLGSLEIIIFLAGVVLILLEIFIIPGFGVAGIMGLVLIVVSLIWNRQDFYWPEFEWQWGVVGSNLLTVFAGIIGSIFAMVLLAWLLPSGGVLNRLVLLGAGESGYADSSRPKKHSRKNSAGSMDGGNLEKSSTEKEQKLFDVGSLGVAVTNLRPVGKVKFGSSVLTAETRGEYCEKGKEVVVLSSDGLRIFVEVKE